MYYFMYINIHNNYSGWEARNLGGGKNLGGRLASKPRSLGGRLAIYIYIYIYTPPPTALRNTAIRNPAPQFELD